MRYLDALTAAMSELAARPDTLFVGQAVRYDGTGMFKTLADVPNDKKIEFPVAENLQLGVCTGLSLTGYLPVCIFPRINFLLEATSQLVQHLDKFPAMGYNSRVIIRTAVAYHKARLYAGPQHTGDYTEQLSSMLETVHVARLHTPQEVLDRYREAVTNPHSTILVEYHGLYDT